MTDLAQYDIDDPGFVNDLKASESHVHKVAQWLRERGHKVREKEIRIRPDVHQMRDYADDGDLEIKERGRVEVKQRKVQFTSKESFPYDTIIVDVAHTWENANPKPIAYILTNKDTTACLIVETSTSEYWIEVKKWDRFKKRERRFLECPIKYCKFFSMV